MSFKVDRQLPDKFGGQKYEQVEITGNREEFKTEFKDWIAEQLEFKPSLVHNAADAVVWMGSGSVFAYVASGFALIGYPIISLLLTMSFIGVVCYGVLVVAKSLPHAQFLISIRLVTFLFGVFLMVL